MPILGLHTSVQWCTWVCLGITPVSAPWTFFVTMAIYKAFPRVGRFIGEKNYCNTQNIFQSCAQHKGVASLQFSAMSGWWPQCPNWVKLNYCCRSHKFCTAVKSILRLFISGLLYSTLLLFTYICVGAWKPVFISRRTFCLYSLYI